MSEVLERFLECSSLLDEDRELLLKKRGFTHELSKSFRLRSACEANRAIIIDLIRKFGEKQCSDVGLTHTKHGKTEPSIKLIDRNILIPYRQNGQVVALRPHKDFQKGQQLRVYYANETYVDGTPTIIAEGEFKAMAAVAYGWQAIAVPGISSFLGDKEAHKKFIEFYEELQIAGILEVVMLFDNEDKGTVGLGKYKEDPKLRYDTQYYAYLMAAKINEYEADVEARVAWIPDKYRDAAGKADIDSVLAAGVPEAEFDEIINNALEPEEFFAALPEEAAGVMHAKLAKRAERISFKIKNNCYWYITVKIGKEGKVTEDEKEVSNFVMKYVSTYVSQEDNSYVYEFQVTNSEGNSSIIKFTGGEMVSAKDFKEKLANFGRFSFSGNSEILAELFIDVVPKEQKLIIKKTFIGWDEELQCLLFDNGFLDDSGNMTGLDNLGLLHIKDKYYKVERETARPEVIFNIGGQTKSLDLVREIGANLIENYGIQSAGDVLAWFIAAAYKPWLFKLNRTFPILGVFGKKSSGKTRMMNWLLALFYEEAEQRKLTSESCTKPGLRSRMVDFSYLPIWVDEFRNTYKSIQLLDLFRSVYDHGSVVIGKPYGAGTMEFKLTSSVIISGEHVPDDETGAVIQRMILVYLKDRPNGTKFKWFEDNYHQFSSVLQYLYKSKDILVPRIISRYDQLLTTYTNRTDIHNRAAINYALIHAVEKEILGLDVSLEADGAKKTFEEIKSDEIDFDLAKDFILRCIGEFRNPHLLLKVKECLGVKHYPVTKQLVIAFNLSKCIDIYNENLRRLGKTTISKQQIKRVLSQCGWLSADTVVYRFEDEIARCESAFLDKAPPEIVLAAHGIASPELKSKIEGIFGGEMGIFPQKDDELDNWNG